MYPILYETGDFMKCHTPVIHHEVSIPYALYQSKKGNYFIGQTPILTGIIDQRSLAALENPPGSDVNLYINAITVTNISALSVSAEIYLHSQFSFGPQSNLVSCANASIFPQPLPNGEIHYLSSAPLPPTSGIPIFSRIIPPFSTVVIDGSQLIIPCHEALTVYLGGYLPVITDSAIVAFGWWEENIHHC